MHGCMATRTRGAVPHTRVVRISAGKLQEEGRGHPSSSLRHHFLPRFRFRVVSRAVAKALSAWAKKAAAKSRLRQGAEAHPGKLLQRRTKLSLPALPSQGPGTRQKDLGKKTSESALPPRPGGSPRMKEAGRQEPASPAKPTSTLPSSDDCQKALQEVWQLPAEWGQVRPKWQEQLEQAKAEWAAWGAWSAGKDRQQRQVRAAIDSAESSSDPLLRGTQGGRSPERGSRTDTRLQGRAWPAHAREGESGSRMQAAKSAVTRGGTQGWVSRLPGPAAGCFQEVLWETAPVVAVCFAESVCSLAGTLHWRHSDSPASSPAQERGSPGEVEKGSNPSPSPAEDSSNL
ncbi:uncharacterized protein LOC121081762 [Falco naumanni]|uniref:uncharacterized protein LOC121081762 n=1 Tax=Falco naumanni TaxID=148594 RepID=UPI001ADE3D51|nr:uncharacterized protein LOC121081762 [Falco naumanni]